MTTMVASVLLRVCGLRCATCAAAVAHALYAVPGVAVAHVAIASREASVDYDPTRTTRSALVAAVRDAGFDVADGEAPQTASLPARPRRLRVTHQLPSAPPGPWYPEVQLMLGIMSGVAGLFGLEHGSHLIGPWVLLLLGASLVGHFFLRRLPM